MAITHGMDIEAVRALATQFGAKENDITSLTNALTTQLNSTDWVGPDATSFRNDWASVHVPALRNVANALSNAQTAANRNANEQTSASM